VKILFFAAVGPRYQTNRFLLIKNLSENLNFLLPLPFLQNQSPKPQLLRSSTTHLYAR